MDSQTGVRLFLLPHELCIAIFEHLFRQTHVHIHFKDPKSVTYDYLDGICQVEKSINLGWLQVNTRFRRDALEALRKTGMTLAVTQIDWYLHCSSNVGWQTVQSMPQILKDLVVSIRIEARDMRGMFIPLPLFTNLKCVVINDMQWIFQGELFGCREYEIYDFRSVQLPSGIHDLELIMLHGGPGVSRGLQPSTYTLPGDAATGNRFYDPYADVERKFKIVNQFTLVDYLENTPRFELSEDEQNDYFDNEDNMENAYPYYILSYDYDTFEAVHRIYSTSSGAPNRLQYCGNHHVTHRIDNSLDCPSTCGMRGFFLNNDDPATF